MRASRPKNERDDQRSPFVRDYDRLLYSKEFRRLSGVTQVARAGEPYIYHDRLTHSLKVSQVARSLANILQDRTPDRRNPNYWINPDVVQTAALAHDLGHPPFGHATEKELNEVVPDDHGGFEGNAQTFRIVTKVAQHREGTSGLNLTRASLNAILKYPWGINTGPKENKWGYYPTEKEGFEWVRRYSNRKYGRCIEADIMDYADDVTYAVHDVEDFYKAGLIPLGRLLSPKDESERNRFKQYLQANDDIDITLDVDDFFIKRLRGIAQPPLETPFDGSDTNLAALNTFTSILIEQFLSTNQPDILYVDIKNGEFVLQRDNPINSNSSNTEVFTEDIEILKQLTFFYVIDDSTLISQQHGQRRIIRKLFDFFSNQVDTGSEYANVIPSPQRERLDHLGGKSDMEQNRLVVDLITSMTERQTYEMYKRLNGEAPGSLREGILR